MRSVGWVDKPVKIGLSTFTRSTATRRPTLSPAFTFFRLLRYVGPRTKNELASGSAHFKELSGGGLFSSPQDVGMEKKRTEASILSRSAYRRS
eukprot:scaffold22612_cov138-Cylindrotheca_fusiformis.AAC.13